jgi:hypothetical protein
MARRWGRCLLVMGAMSAWTAPDGARALDFNLIPNGDFDDLGDMDIVDDWTELFPLQSEMNNITDDVDDCPFSGAADGINTSADDSGGVTFVACATEVSSAESYIATGYVRFPIGTDASRFNGTMFFTKELNCFGDKTGSTVGTGNPILYDQATEWTPFTMGPITAPANAKSLSVRVLLVKDFGADNVADLYFDKIYVTKADFIFAEDFESGYACRWSNEVGFAP